MGNFLDILSGRIFNFRNANGEDINAGSSDKLIVTPKALSKSDAFSNASIPLVLPASFLSKSSSLSTSTYVFVIPTNGFFFPKRETKIQAQLFAFVMADSNSTGEVCLMDSITNKVIAESEVSFSNSSWACVSSKIIEIEAGKTYALGLRKSSGAFGKTVQVRAATLTLKLLSA